MTTFAEKIFELDAALNDSGIAHAFGGALALAFCTREPRLTSDIDVNVFLTINEVQEFLDAVPSGLAWDEESRQLLQRDGQVRLWWDATPVDVFLATSEFHREAASRVRIESIDGHPLPFLSCRDLAVFKVFFDRLKDWADLEAMLLASSVDLDATLGTLARYLGPDDHRIAHLLEMSRSLPTYGVLPLFRPTQEQGT